jgi:hypothetical protein
MISPSNRLSLAEVVHWQIGLARIYNAFKYSCDTNSDIWEFAVSIKQLGEFGCDHSDLRWLVRKGLVEQKCEITSIQDHVRTFSRTGDLIFDEFTCFVITEKGLSLCKKLQLPNPLKQRNPNDPFANNGNVALVEIFSENQPVWEESTHKLHFNGLLVKQFKCPAQNQETVLSAFQEEGWPQTIFDPLIPHPEQNSKRRLADTIKCLNRKQKTQLITFRGDGSGQGIMWERTHDLDPEMQCNR